jgi:hypothetical protein
MESEHKCGNCGSGCGSTKDSTKGCGCNKKKSKTMTIVENSKEILCNILQVFDFDEHKYIALQDKDSDRIYLYRYTEKNDDVVLNEIENIEELRLVGRALIEYLEE